MTTNHPDLEPADPAARPEPVLLTRGLDDRPSVIESSEGVPSTHPGSSAPLRLNHLLTALEEVAAELPAPLDRRAAFEWLQHRISGELAPTAVCVLELDSLEGTWSPKLATGCTMPDTMTADRLPGPLRTVVATLDPLVVPDLEACGPGVAPSSGSGVYVPLLVGRELVGVAAIEHSVAGRFGPEDLDIAVEEAGGWALLIDNVRRFGRVRALGADATEARLARELHDRLGQWLTYVSMEIEGVMLDRAVPAPALARLHTAVQSAIEEMRDKLRQLLAGVTADRPLHRVAREICERFEERTEIEVTYKVAHPDKRLTVPVETELSRILLLALSNCENHSAASRVRVLWDTDGATGRLTISDDGVGFEPDEVVRDAAGGLIDMRNRANSIGATLRFSSRPGEGTTVSIATSDTSKERTP